jgi:hypothetical protein
MMLAERDFNVGEIVFVEEPVLVCSVQPSGLPDDWLKLGKQLQNLVPCKNTEGVETFPLWADIRISHAVIVLLYNFELQTDSVRSSIITLADSASFDQLSPPYPGLFKKAKAAVVKAKLLKAETLKHLDNLLTLFFQNSNRASYPNPFLSSF